MHKPDQSGIQGALVGGSAVLELTAFMKLSKAFSGKYGYYIGMVQFVSFMQKQAPEEASVLTRLYYKWPLKVLVMNTQLPEASVLPGPEARFRLPF